MTTMAESREGKIAMSHDIWPDLLLLAFDPEVSQVVGLIEAVPSRHKAVSLRPI